MINVKKIVSGILILYILIVVIQFGKEHPGFPVLGNSAKPSLVSLQTEINTEDGTLFQDVKEKVLIQKVEAETSFQGQGWEDYIDSEGQSLESRILTPEGFKRTEAVENSLLAFFRQSEMKEDGSPALLYDGREKGNQSAHVAIFAMDVDNRDLQQCADSIMRMYAEYYWRVGAYDKINFHLTNGFLMEYSKWREGYRLNGSQNGWNMSSGYDDSYESFRQYLIQVFIYAGTISLDHESRGITNQDIKTGDMFIKGGSPGHCVLVVDMAEDDQGNKCFLLAQGYMPAQEFHVINNPLHLDNPWYYLSELVYPLSTAEYTFMEGSLKRWGEFE